AERLFQRLDEIQKFNRTAPGNVDHTPWGHGRERVCRANGLARHRRGVGEAEHRIDEISHIGEVSLHLALTVDVDGPSLGYRGGKFDGRHVGPTPGAIDREEPETGRRDVPEM